MNEKEKIKVLKSAGQTIIPDLSLHLKFSQGITTSKFKAGGCT